PVFQESRSSKGRRAVLVAAQIFPMAVGARLDVRGSSTRRLCFRENAGPHAARFGARIWRLSADARFEEAASVDGWRQHDCRENQRGLDRRSLTADGQRLR